MPKNKKIEKEKEIKNEIEKEKEIKNENEKETKTVEDINSDQINTELNKEELMQLEVDRLQKELADERERLLRLAAEFDNYRKRTIREREGIFIDATVKILSATLPILDNLERATVEDTRDFAGYKDGVNLVLKQAVEIFSGLNANSIGNPSEIFDPLLHNAVMHIEDETYKAGEIVEVFQKGYSLGDRVIRHATVKVAN